PELVEMLQKRHLSAIYIVVVVGGDRVGRLRTREGDQRHYCEPLTRCGPAAPPVRRAVRRRSAPRWSRRLPSPWRRFHAARRGGFLPRAYSSARSRHA